MSWPPCCRAWPDPGEAAHRLVEIANEHGGSDNITVVVVDVLVGEDTPAHASVITPLGARAGSPLLVGTASASGAVFAPGTAPAPGPAPSRGPAPVKPASDVFTEGRSWASAARPGRCAETACAPLSSCRTRRRPSRWPGPPTARFLRAFGAPPRRPTRPPPAPPPPRDPAAHHAAVVLFILLIAAVPTADLLRHPLVRLRQLYLSVQKHEIVVNQGHPGGVLWFHPRVVDRTRTTTSQLLPSDVAQIRAGGAGALAAGGEALCGQPSQRVRQRAEREAPTTPRHHDRCSGTPPSSPPISTTPTVAPTGTTAPRRPQ